MPAISMALVPSPRHREEDAEVQEAGEGVAQVAVVLERLFDGVDSAPPSRRRAGAHVVGLLEERAEPVPVGDIELEVNARRSRIEAMLKVLEVEGAVERVERTGWRRTLKPWVYDDERVARVTALRRDEQAAMLEYAKTGECRVAFLRCQLDDPSAARCTAGFTVANAMGRNKVIYARARLVVAANLGKGGTWAGAAEALRQASTAVLVWMGDGAGEGNPRLLERGAIGLERVSELFPLPPVDGGTRLCEPRPQQLPLDV